MANTKLRKEQVQMGTGKLLGRNTAGAGSLEEITLGTNLSFSGTTLNATGGGSLTNWTEAVNTSAPNATVPAVSFTATNAATDVDAVIKTKGTGAILAQIPDNSTTGGNKRGTHATDFQKERASASQVASGNYSGILAGANNTASHPYSAVAGGASSYAANTYAAVLGGVSTQANGTSSACVAGDQCQTNGDWSVTVGGYKAQANGAYTMASGGESKAYLRGSRAVAARQFGALGDAQGVEFVAKVEITGTAATQLTLWGDNIVLATGNTIWNGVVQIVATLSTVGNGSGTIGDSFIGTYNVGIKRLGSSTSLVGTVQTISTAGDTTMTSSTVAITADDTNEALKIMFTPDGAAAGTTSVTRVVAYVQLAELAY